jgi:hypothetical protein
MLQLKNETTGHVALEISGGGALIGIDGAADSVHILAICGNPLIKSSGIAYDGTVISSSALPTTGSVTTNGSANATITTNTGQRALGSIGANVTSLATNSMNIHADISGHGYRYAFW